MRGFRFSLPASSIIDFICFVEDFSEAFLLVLGFFPLLFGIPTSDIFVMFTPLCFFATLFSSKSRQYFCLATATVWAHILHEWNSMQLCSQTMCPFFLHSTKNGRWRAWLLLWTSQALPSLQPGDMQTLFFDIANCWLSLQILSATYRGKDDNCNRGLLSHSSLLSLKSLESWTVVKSNSVSSSMDSYSADLAFLAVWFMVSLSDTVLNFAVKNRFITFSLWASNIWKKFLVSTWSSENSEEILYSPMPTIARSTSFFWFSIILFIESINWGSSWAR